MKRIEVEGGCESSPFLYDPYWELRLEWLVVECIRELGYTVEESPDKTVTIH